MVESFLGKRRKKTFEEKGGGDVFRLINVVLFNPCKIRDVVLKAQTKQEF